MGAKAKLWDQAGEDERGGREDSSGWLTCRVRACLLADAPVCDAMCESRCQTTTNLRTSPPPLK